MCDLLCVLIGELCMCWSLCQPIRCRCGQVIDQLMDLLYDTGPKSESGWKADACCRHPVSVGSSALGACEVSRCCVLARCCCQENQRLQIGREMRLPHTTSLRQGGQGSSQGDICSGQQHAATAGQANPRSIVRPHGHHHFLQTYAHPEEACTAQLLHHLHGSALYMWPAKSACPG